MELFFTTQTDGKTALLSKEESAHCVKVLRHKAGDKIVFTDGAGNIYDAQITSISSGGVLLAIIGVREHTPPKPYTLHMAVAPTKNNDRFEWFVEKAVEIGIDRITPIIGKHSERRVYNCERAGRISLSAMKQSLKSRFTQIDEPVSVDAFLKEQTSNNSLKLIAYCGETDELQAGGRVSVYEAIESFVEERKDNFSDQIDILIMIGPEGDFSKEEVRLAVDFGFKIIHLGTSRLRTETAAVAAVSSIYFYPFNK